MVEGYDGRVCDKFGGFGFGVLSRRGSYWWLLVVGKECAGGPEPETTCKQKSHFIISGSVGSSC